jgi:hypothetical protein
MGHHFYYVRLLVEQALSGNNKTSILLLTSELAISSKEFQVHLAKLQGLQTQTLAAKDFRLRTLSKHPSVSNADLISFPDADRLLPQLALGSWSASGKSTFLVMRADGETKMIKGLGVAVGFAKKLFIVIGNMRDNIYVYSLKSPLSKRLLPIPWISDPITIVRDDWRVDDLRGKLGQMPPCYWLGVFGDISPRKNLPLIVESVFNASDIGLLVAGRIDPAVLIELKPKLDLLREVGRLFELSGTLEDIDLDSAISAVDCVVAAHSNDGPSGIVAKAAILGKPLVLAGSRTLKRDAKNLRDQAKWSKLDSSSLAKNVACIRAAGSSEYPKFQFTDDFASKLIP